VKIASVRGTTFTDEGLNLNTPYVYAVRGPGGTTGQITLIPGTVASTPTSTSTTSTPPPPGGGAPANLRKSAQTSSSITLTWDGSPTGSYDILRGEDGVKIATVTGTTFTDIGLLARTPYVYSVRGSGSTSQQVTLSIT
jgi:chitodextrinase